eukprot:scaffold12607_cov68-Skeletonema_dohrnii-CCMP3373.AAC.2
MDFDRSERWREVEDLPKLPFFGVGTSCRGRVHGKTSYLCSALTLLFSPANPTHLQPNAPSSLHSGSSPIPRRHPPYTLLATMELLILQHG